MKRIVLALVSLMVCSGVFGFQFSGVYKECYTWTYDTQSRVLEIGWKNGTPPDRVVPFFMRDFREVKTSDGTINICLNMYKLILPEGLKLVPEVGELMYVKEIYIPASIVSLQASTFNKCPNLQKITISPDNTRYTNVARTRTMRVTDGLVYSKDTTELICCPRGLITATFHPKVRKLAPQAFAYCRRLRYVDIVDIDKYTQAGYVYLTSVGERCFKGSDNLDSFTEVMFAGEIGESAFEDCTNLLNVEIKGEKIGEAAFKNCTRLEYLAFYEGVKEIGAEAFCGCSALKKVVFPKGLQTIGHAAFSKCTSLAEVTIPNTVTEIKSYAFSGTALPADRNGLIYASDCLLGVTGYAKENLRSVTVKNGTRLIANSCFLYCEQLRQVSLPDGIQYIGGWAFEECGSLTTINLPRSLRRIGQSAFSDTRALRKAGKVYYVDHCLVEANMYRIDNCVRVEDGTHLIADYAFGAAPDLSEGWEYAYYYGLCAENNLEQVILPSSVKYIGYQAFFSATKLKQINLSNVEEIDDEAFLGCSSLQRAELVHAKRVGSKCFANNKSLSHIHLGQYLRFLGADFIKDCTGLTSVYWDIPRMPDYTSMKTPFYKCTRLADGRYYTEYDLREQIKSFTFGPNVHYIPNWLCCDMKNITYINLPDNITNMGLEALMSAGNDKMFLMNKTLLVRVPRDTKGTFHVPDGITKICLGAFQGCTQIKKVTLPESLRVIEIDGFYGCSGLQSIVIPRYVDELGDKAFCNCSSLVKIRFKSRTPPKMGYYCFYGCPETLDVKFPPTDAWKALLK